MTSTPRKLPIPARARGIDHVGLTVHDIQRAERFLVDGLGAEFLYETLSTRDPPLGGPEVERLVRLPANTQINVIRMYRMETGPGIELFQYTTADQRAPARGCDFGWQHVALYVDDIQASAARATAAGAEQLNSAWPLMNAESGAGSAFCFLSMPFGGLLELITYPSALSYESATAKRRWKPPPNA